MPGTGMCAEAPVKCARAHRIRIMCAECGVLLRPLVHACPTPILELGTYLLSSLIPAPSAHPAPVHCSPLDLDRRCRYGENGAVKAYVRGNIHRVPAAGAIRWYVACVACGVRVLVPFLAAV